ncbi:MAG: MotA/TolQ/ExbB proton channel family protein, partial [Sulfurimonas sp.]|nr:MotA/TolQ/ExbB proton channel family protein [Sulfurimonas sp.]
MTANDLIDFYLKSHPVTIGVLAVLSIYFIILNWVFFYRYFSLSSWLSDENDSFEGLLMGASSVNEKSFLNNFMKTSSSVSKEILALAMMAATKEAT